MSTVQLPFVAVMLSALLHAIWNLAAKKTPYKGAFIWIITAWGSLCLLPVALYVEGGSISWHPSAWIFPLFSIFSQSKKRLPCIPNSIFTKS